MKPTRFEAEAAGDEACVVLAAAAATLQCGRGGCGGGRGEDNDADIYSVVLPSAHRLPIPTVLQVPCGPQSIRTQSVRPRSSLQQPMVHDTIAIDPLCALC